MVSTREEVQDDLREFRDGMIECMRGALAEFAERYREERHYLSRGSQASIIHDIVVRRFTAKYGTLADAEGDLAVHKKGNLRQLVFQHGKYKIRLKKLGRSLLARNIQTHAVIQFNWQQESFRQIEPSTSLNLGYEPLDDASVTSSNIWVTCPNGNSVGWTWLLSDVSDVAAAETRAAIIPIPPAQQERRAKPKKGAVPEKPEADEVNNDGGGRSDI